MTTRLRLFAYHAIAAVSLCGTLLAVAPPLAPMAVGFSAVYLAMLAVLYELPPEDAVDGGLFRATIVRTSESTSLDVKAAEAKLRELGVDGRWFSKNLKVRKGSVSVRVVARKA